MALENEATNIKIDVSSPELNDENKFLEGLNNFCGSVFWDENVTVYTDNPDFTPCFQQTALTWIPILFLWIFGPIYYYSTKDYQKQKIPKTWLNLAKSFLCIVLIILTFTEVVEGITRYAQGSTVHLVDPISPGLLCITFIITILIIHYDRMKGIRSSGLLFIFWFILALCGAITLRSKIMDGANNDWNIDDEKYFRFVTFMIYYPLVFLQLCLSVLSDRKASYREILSHEQYQLNERGSMVLLPRKASLEDGGLKSLPQPFLDLNPCPEDDSSFLSRITFWWFTGMAITGFKRPLERKDMWTLNDIDLSRNVTPLFEKYWEVEVNKYKNRVAQCEVNQRRKEECEMDGNSHKPSPQHKGWGHIRSKTKEDKQKDGKPMISNDKGGAKKEIGNSTEREELCDCEELEIAIKQCKKNPSIAPTAILWVMARTFGRTFLAGTLLKMMHDILIYVQPQLLKKIKKEPSIFLPMVKEFGPEYLLGSFYKLVTDLMTFVSPQILELLINYTNDKSVEEWKGYFYASLMFGSAIIQSLILHQYFHKCMIVGMRVRTAVISTVYRKALRLSNSARKTSTVGEMVNLMSVDAQRFMDLTMYLNMLWSAPLQIILALVFLWNTLGPSVLSGVAVMVLLIPLNGVIATYTRKFQVTQMKLKDQRIKLMNEVLNGIKVLKLYAWEGSFQDKVLDIRADELEVLKKQSYLSAFSTFVWVCAPFLVSITTFATYVLIDSDNKLTPDKAFVALSLFNILRFPMSMLPMLIAFLVQAQVSLKRLTTYLVNDELDLKSVERGPSSDNPLTVEGGSFGWDKEGAPILEGINFEVKKGELIAVVGQVGSGKSSLISAVLGEMEKMGGKVQVNGSVAYVPQQAWIQNATLKNNILFNEPLDDDKYQKVLESCSLITDLEVLPAKDLTEIGEKGINLSGGQKQRVALARAVYSESDIYLLDDPLSAVDAHVGKHIFHEVVGKDGLLKDKTRILVTHGISFLPKADKIICLTDGKISEVGHYCDLLRNNGAFAEFIKTYLTSEAGEEVLSEIGEDDEELELREEILANIDLPPERRDRLYTGERSPNLHRSDNEASPQLLNDSLARQRSRLRSESNVDPEEHEVDAKTVSPSRQISRQFSRQISRQKSVEELAQAEATKLALAKQVEKKKMDTLIQAEYAETGKVKIGVYMAYIKAIGWFTFALIVILYTLSNGCSVGSNVWLSDWSEDNVSLSGDKYVETRNIRLGVYGALGFGQGAFVLLGSLVMTFGLIQASTFLHMEMLERIIKSPMSFFDTTPLGRIVNRFAKDVDVMDNIIPMNIRAWLNTMFSVLSTIIVICFSTPIFTTVIVPLGILYYFIQRFYVSTSRQLKRLESVSRSPIYSHFGETVTGASTIRAYNLQDKFIEESERKVDENQTCYYPAIVSNRWLAVRLEFVGNCIVLFAALFAVIARGDIEAGLVGLSISYSLNVTQTLNWMVRMTSELETNIVAVERIKEYSEIEVEDDWVHEENRPNDDWPDKGAVSFQDYKVRYRPGLDLVLHGITADIKGGEKIGIVGRTGAGKSSLTLAVFRIIEAADGKITIDGHDIAKLGLHDLRSRITIIPQDPVLFSGTLRINLDPFERHTDDEIWSALELAHLKTFVKTLPTALQHEISEGGENLSVGQRQLVCLARALLRKTKVLVLDEATAAVDLETDDLIQSTIRTEFADGTVLTIAHRINTIMDYTRIMVLDNGRIKEFDTPDNLLKDNKTIFYGLCEDAGLV